MNRKHIGFAAFILGFFCFVKISAAEQKRATRPLNVVLILADDLGWSDLGCYGADLHETPHIDALAQQGMRFTDAYAASICSPTRAALLTGKHYARLHITIWREGSLRTSNDRQLLPAASASDLPHEELTLAEALKNAGYRTAIVGKWHLGGATHYPETQGFDVNVGGTLWGAPPTYFFPYRGSKSFGGEFRYVPHLEGGREGEYLTDRLTDEALKIIDSAGEHPFFLYLAHHAVHAPIEAKAAMVEHYQGRLKPGLHHNNPKYAAMVQSLDESVGRVLHRIEERGLLDRTLVIFLSDNGGLIGQFGGKQVTNNHPLRSGKGSLYEGGVRVPMIIRGPSIPAGKICNEPVFVADIFPTVMELAGLTLKVAETANLDGQSLAPLLKAPSTKLARDALYFHYPHYYATTTPVSAIRSRDWKLLEYHEDGHVELYRLADDLGETNDLTRTLPEQAKKLQSQLAQWRKRIGARMPTKNPGFAPKK